jgi:PIN domain nuclease of toxin-antitoxin system
VTEFVLDASALIAMLREEPGAKEVAEAIADAHMSVFNYAEIVSYFIHAGMDEHDIDAMLDPLPIELVPADKDLARLAGQLRRPTADAGRPFLPCACQAKKLARLDGRQGLEADCRRGRGGSGHHPLGMKSSFRQRRNRMRTGRFHEEFRAPAGVGSSERKRSAWASSQASGNSVACPVFAVADQKLRSIVSLTINVRHYVTV